MTGLQPQEVSFDRIWGGLKERVGKVITLSSTAGMPMFEDVYKLCTAPTPYSEKLYHSLREFLESHSATLYKGMVDKQSDLLTEYLKRWTEWDTGCRFLNNIFNYLNMHWIKKKIDDSHQKLTGATGIYGGGGLGAGLSAAAAGGIDPNEIHQIYTLTLVTWKINIFDKLKDRLNRDLLEQIRKEREGERIEASEIAGIIMSYVKLGLIKQNKPLKVYKEDFEEVYLKACKDYYAIESTNYIAHNGVALYMRKAEDRIKEEEARAKKYLDSSSFDRVVEVCNAVLITAHREIMQVECEQMLKEERRADLKRMYHLLNRIENGIQPMLDVLQNYVTAAGNAAVKQLVEGGALTELGFGPKKAEESTSSASESTAAGDKPAEASLSTTAAAPPAAARGRGGAPRGRGRGAGRGKGRAGEEGGEGGEGTGSSGPPVEPSQEYAEVLLKNYIHYSGLVKEAFENNSHFVAALDRASRTVVNENCVAAGSSKSPELLAKYTDFLLRKSQRHFDEQEVDSKLGQILLLFKYLDEKDVFKKFYTHLLARRLLYGTSVSDDAEKVMIAGLKEASGFEYTSKLQRMFTDIQLSTEINEKFKQHSLDSKIEMKFEFSILVLTSGSWPLFGQDSNFTAPAEIEQCIGVFQNYYFKAYQARRLAWLHHLSTGDVQMMYTKKKYTMTATNYQMGILVLFNNAARLSRQEIKTLTALPDGDLQRTIKSLIDCKILKVEITETAGDDGEEKDGEKKARNSTFYLNDKFASPRLKFKIAGALQAETPQQSSDTYKAIQVDRNLYLQAAIVRVMKARKQMRHNDLVAEVITQSKNRFHPQIAMIKKCIEYLIEKEYMERGEGDLYAYKA